MLKKEKNKKHISEKYVLHNLYPRVSKNIKESAAKVLLEVFQMKKKKIKQEN